LLIGLGKLIVTTQGAALLEVNNIEVTYLNVIRVIRGLSLRVREGEIVSLLGANGAGKTTTLRAISGVLHDEEGEITKGTILFNGQSIDRLPPEQIASKGILQVMEGGRIFQQLTVKENLIVGAQFSRKRSEVEVSLDRVLHYFPRLKGCLPRKSGFLSGGERQMLVIGRALMATPKVLLLDEPSLGLAPLVVSEIFEIIRTINRENGTSILLVEQNAHLALQIARYAYVLENGRMVLEGEAEKLRDNEDVKEFYLGISDKDKKGYRNIKHYKRRKRWIG